METLKVKTVDRRVNTINKYRDTDGAWVYQILGKDEVTLAELKFQTGREIANRLTNSDLLEVVRDRLEMLNRSPVSSFRSAACLQHVIEALFWADAPAFVGDLDNTNETRLKGE